MSSKEIKYLSIAESIKKKILNKIYLPGSSLPSEKVLCGEYDVSRMTIRKAIEILSGEGYVRSMPGKGTFVKEFSNNKFEFIFEIEKVIRGGYTSAKLLHAKIMAPTIELVYHLQVAPKTKIVCIRSMLFQNERPVALDEKYIPYFPGMDIEEESFSYHDMASIIYGKNHAFGHREEITINGIVTDEAVDHFFKEAVGNSKQTKQKFMMLFEEKMYDSDDIPVGYGKLYVESDLCELKGKFKV